MHSVALSNTVLVGDDTFLVVLVCCHACVDSHGLVFCPEPKENKSASHLEHQGNGAMVSAEQMPAHPVFSCSSLQSKSLLTIQPSNDYILFSYAFVAVGFARFVEKRGFASNLHWNSLDKFWYNEV